jgi:hypothetical protein
MPFGEAHTRQKKKNYVLLAILVGFVVMFVTITMLRMGGAG